VLVAEPRWARGSSRDDGPRTEEDRAISALDQLAIEPDDEALDDRHGREAGFPRGWDDYLFARQRFLGRVRPLETEPLAAGTVMPLEGLRA
jgi:hypothetical protein